jgi:hypothetical protein
MIRSKTPHVNFVAFISRSHLQISLGMQPGISTASGISDYASKANDSIATNGITERLRWADTLWLSKSLQQIAMEITMFNR